MLYISISVSDRNRPFVRLLAPSGPMLLVALPYEEVVHVVIQLFLRLHHLLNEIQRGAYW
jgi:hypothetical protein